jgi:hypothetical protein
MRALIKRLAHYSPIDTPTIVSFVYFRVDPEPRTTLHVNFSELRKDEVRTIYHPGTRAELVRRCPTRRNSGTSLRRSMPEDSPTPTAAPCNHL